MLIYCTHIPTHTHSPTNAFTCVHTFLHTNKNSLTCTKIDAHIDIPTHIQTRKKHKLIHTHIHTLISTECDIYFWNSLLPPFRSPPASSRHAQLSLCRLCWMFGGFTRSSHTKQNLSHVLFLQCVLGTSDAVAPSRLTSEFCHTPIENRSLCINIPSPSSGIDVELTTQSPVECKASQKPPSTRGVGRCVQGEVTGDSNARLGSSALGLVSAAPACRKSCCLRRHGIFIYLFFVAPK